MNSSTADQKLGGTFWLLPVGAVLAAISLFEGSLVWAVFCIVTAWLGFAAGIAGGVGLADRIEDELKHNGNVSLARPKLPELKDIALFWGPNLAVIWLGQLMLDKLPDEIEPRSYKSYETLSFIESSSIYFCWTGAAFYETWRRARLATADAVGDESDDDGQ